MQTQLHKDLRLVQPYCIFFTSLLCLCVFMNRISSSIFVDWPSLEFNSKLVSGQKNRKLLNFLDDLWDGISLEGGTLSKVLGQVAAMNTQPLP